MIVVLSQYLLIYGFKYLCHTKYTFFFNARVNLYYILFIMVPRHFGEKCETWQSRFRASVTLY